MSDEHDIDDDAAEIIADVREDAAQAGADAARWEAWDARIRAIEERSIPDPVDLSPVDSRFDRIEATLRDLADRVTPPAPPAPPDPVPDVSAEADTETEADDEDDDDPPDIPPQIDIRAASRAAVKRERAPTGGHFMFRRIGRKG